ncbi:MAG: hypothetical protein AB1641_26995 [Thermodesulfobacteriota bacterium]
MPQPRYPTQEGLWSKGARPEKSQAQVQLELPYREAVHNFRQATAGRDDFDPATLFVWGTMQATAVLNILKAAEEAFGRAGQETVRKAVNQAGYEAARQMLANSTLPRDLPEIELLSYIVTGLNTILYASLEKPWIVDRNRCEFDILWCPHQDRYTAFDCRVQRYFVEGMIRAIEDWGLGDFVPEVEKLIPRGDEACHFVVRRFEGSGGRHPWDAYSDQLERRALEKMKK